MALHLVALIVSTSIPLTRYVPLPSCGAARVARCATPMLAISAVQLMRQSEVLELLSSVQEVGLADPGDASRPSDVVSLGLVRGVDIEEDSGGVKVMLELPAEAVSVGTSDRVRAHT